MNSKPTTTKKPKVCIPCPRMIYSWNARIAQRTNAQSTEDTLIDFGGVISIDIEIV
jgi:hypothetical protein